MKRVDAVYELKKVFDILSEDLERATHASMEDDSQFNRRNVFRTYFAFVEGLAFQLRQVSLASLAETDQLTDGEQAILREERFQLTHKGLPEVRENFQSFLPNLLFSVHCYVKIHGASFSPNTGIQGWDAMRKAVAIRDRLTHPRSEAGLVVSDDDVQTLGAASAWWKKTLLDMFAACGEADVAFQKLLQRPQ